MNLLRAQSAGLSWEEQQTLFLGERYYVDLFGNAVDLDGDVALVGVPGDDGADGVNSEDSGSAYLFRRHKGTWNEHRRLGAEIAADSAQFGLSVAIDDSTSIVGAPRAGIPSGGTEPDLSRAGLVYAFRSSKGDWAEPAQVLVDPAPAEGRSFGTAIAVSGDTFLAGAPSDGASRPGQAYAFGWSGLSWQLEHELAPAGSARAPDYFGSALALEGATAVVGARTDAEHGAVAGVAYIFTREGSTWTEQQRLHSRDIQANHAFGAAVGISGDTIAVGATGVDEGLGAVYVFRRTAGVWTEQQKLVADGGTTGNGFARELSIDGETLVVGAPFHADIGAVFPYQFRGAVWEALAPLFADNPSYDARFGTSVSVSGGTVLVGAPYADYAQGVVISLGKSTGSECVTSADCASSHCVQGVCCNEACEDRCYSCLGAETAAGIDGECRPVAEGTPPRDGACATQAPSTCGTTGRCDGQGQCALHTAGTLCAAAACADANTEDPADFCDGRGSCEHTEPQGCDGYGCTDAACIVVCRSDDDCDSDRLCDSSSRCKPKLGLGEECTSDRNCRSGHCADGVCCSTDCDGQCEACAEPASTGTCIPVSGKPRGSRDSCPNAPSDDPCAQVMCDGSDPDACSEFVGASVLCQSASCSEGIAWPEARCDGHGECAASEPAECGAFGCGQTACLSTCESDRDCRAGSYCAAGECLTGPRCSEDGRRAIDPDGSAENCGVYECRSGACLRECSSVDECADPDTHFCNPSTHQCEELQRVTRSSGCGCRTGASSEGDHTTRALAALILLLGTRLRRRATRQARTYALENGASQ